jgi:hypothetical protein
MVGPIRTQCDRIDVGHFIVDGNPERLANEQHRGREWKVAHDYTVGFEPPHGAPDLPIPKWVGEERETQRRAYGSFTEAPDTLDLHPLRSLMAWLVVRIAGE